MADDDRPGRFERRAGVPLTDLAGVVPVVQAAIAAAHTIIETTSEDQTRELARTVVVQLQRLRVVVKGEHDV